MQAYNSMTYNLLLNTLKWDLISVGGGLWKELRAYFCDVEFLESISERLEERDSWFHGLAHLELPVVHQSNRGWGTALHEYRRKG